MFLVTFVTVVWVLRQKSNYIIVEQTPAHTIEDREHIQRTLKGDTRAYNALVEKYQSLVFVLVRNVCHNDADAQELAQDVFVKAYQQLRTFRGQSAFATWLYRIAYNTAISAMRKKQVEQRRSGLYEQDVLHNEDADEVFEEDARYRRLRDLVAALPPEERLLIELYYYKELSMKEVAYIVGMGESNVKVRIHRIRQKISIQWTTC